MVTEVIFRHWRNDVVALFPYEIADLEGNCLSYMTVGQHGSAKYNAILPESRPATPAEYASLQAELVSIGYHLKIVQRRHYRKYCQAVSKVLTEEYNANNSKNNQ